jgi:hypothetical protein
MLIRAMTIAVYKITLPRRAPAAAKSADKHYDWLWELVTFLICVVLALIVFLATSGLRPGL